MHAVNDFDAPIVEIREVLDSPAMPAPGNAEYDHASWLEQPAHVFEGDSNRRRKMLKDFGRNKKVQRALELRRRGDNIQPRLGVVVRVGVAELLRERNRVTVPISHAHAANFWAIREVGQGQAPAK